MAKNAGKAVQYYKTAADQGYAKAEFNLALCYENGISVSKDEGKAVKCLYYKMAAEQGHAQAQNMLACCYQNGDLGVTPDEGKAVQYYKMVATQRDTEAQAALSDLGVLAIGPPVTRAMEGQLSLEPKEGEEQQQRDNSSKNRKKKKKRKRKRKRKRKN